MINEKDNNTIIEDSKKIDMLEKDISNKDMIILEQTDKINKIIND